MICLRVLDRWCGALGRGIAGASVAVMVTLSALIVAEAFARTFFFVTFPGFFEIAAFLLAVGILACFPASIAARSHLTIDFVGKMLPPPVRGALGLLGGALLLAFLALLAWRFGVYAAALEARGQKMAGAPVPLAPFFWAAAAALAICVPLQLVVLLAQAGELARGPARAADRSEARRNRLVAIVVGVLILVFVVVVLNTTIVTLAADFLRREPPLLGTVFFFGVWGLIVLLVPLGAAMGLTGLAGLVILLGVDPALNALGFYNARFISNPNLATLPLFLLMGNFAIVAGLADDIYALANIVLRRWRGGLAHATIMGCAGFGTVTGSSVACAAAMGAVSLPEMRRRGYSPALAAGCVAAGGTLGQLIPPSTIIVLYCFLTEVSIGRMFIAVLVPAAITVALYMAVVSAYVRVVPSAAPPTEAAAGGALLPALLRCWGVALMFALVVGGLYTGVFTANEAAAVGAATSFAFALGRGKLKGEALWRVMGETAATTAMLFMIILGAVTFSFFLGATQFADRATDWILAQNLPAIGVVAVLVVVYLVLGTAMESATILLITTPIVAPVIQELGFDLVWWGIVMVVVVEAGIISPPYGLNMFIIQSMQPDISLAEIFRGVMPFFYATLVVIALLIAFPELILWLPSTMMG
jgi:tripartite ATP-independent transporter DctM subunit